MASKYCDRVKSCKHSWWCADDYNPERDNHECFSQKTHYDEIRDMSIEELAEYLIRDVEAEAIRRAGRYLTNIEIDRAVVDCLDWLKSPVEDNE